LTLDFTTPGKVIVKMQDYIEEMLDELPLKFSGLSATPAADHMFRVDKDVEKLNEEKISDLFHHFTMKLLYLSKRARPDVQTAAAFLTTRVKAPDVDENVAPWGGSY
jgi:hypothetical protein